MVRSIDCKKVNMNSNNRIYGDSYSPYTFPDHGYDTSVVLTWNHPLSHYKSPADRSGMEFKRI